MIARLPSIKPAHNQVFHSGIQLVGATRIVNFLLHVKLITDYSSAVRFVR
ncbi:MAG: hypothetical protein OJF51_003220 [Nitrospira sp.]|nr:MAG: hypothetical protein OJF51_003220 [Nitrospira sp.]